MTQAEKKKRIQNKKSGKVVRVRDQTWALFSQERAKGETVDDVIIRLLQSPPKAESSPIETKLKEINEKAEYYILPRHGIVCKTRAEALGQSIILAVRQGKKRPVEDPVRVREA